MKAGAGYLRFESSVNLYGGQTAQLKKIAKDKFESSVNLYGGQTSS